MWIHRIIEQCVPQWTHGPCSYQPESWAHTLDKISLILIAPTGSSKTTAFYAPLLVMEHLLGNPIAGIPQPPSHPIALIVTPLIELGNNHVSFFKPG
jgi:superfamily II DNA/RNA helicase